MPALRCCQTVLPARGSTGGGEGEGARGWCTEGGKGLVREGGKGLAATELDGAALGWLVHGGSDLGRICCCHFNQRVRR